MTEKTENMPVKVTIELDDKGLVKLTSLDQMAAFAKRCLDSGMLPSHYQNAGQVITAWQYAGELGLKPISSMRQISMINGTPTIWGDLPLAIARQQPNFEWIDEIFIDAEQNEICWANKNLNSEVWGVVCQIQRKGFPRPIERVFTREDAAKANLLNNPKKEPWQKYTKDMLMYKARSRALKSAFPDALNGFAIAESDFDVMPRFSDNRDVIIDIESEPTPSADAKTIAQHHSEMQVLADQVKKINLLEKIDSLLEKAKQRGDDLTTIQQTTGIDLSNLTDLRDDQLYALIEVLAA